jgi:Tn3 transposase DDE domain-containing protein
MYQNRRLSFNLVVAAITLWNTVYLERAIDALRQHQVIDESLLKHVALLGWEHINLTSDYVRRANRHVAKGQFRSLRPVKTSIFNA